MSVNMAPGPTEETLLRQYEAHADLLKYYLELVVKVNAFYYVLTGAILSYVLLHNQQPILKWSLGLPVVLGLGISVVEVFGAIRSRVMGEEIVRTAKTLRLIAWPEVRVLTLSIWASVAVRTITLLGLLWLIFCGAEQLRQHPS